MSMGYRNVIYHMTNRVDASEHGSGCYAIATPALPASKETITNKIAAT